MKEGLAAPVLGEDLRLLGDFQPSGLGAAKSGKLEVSVLDKLNRANLCFKNKMVVEAANLASSVVPMVWYLRYHPTC